MVFSNVLNLFFKCVNVKRELLETLCVTNCIIIRDFVYFSPLIVVTIIEN